MGTFAEFKAKKKQNSRRGSPYLETCFGSHSKSSSTDKTISEASMYDAKELTAKEHREIHDAAPHDKLDDLEIEAVHDYCDDSKRLNSSLINYHNGHSMRESEKPVCNKLDSLLSRHKTTKDIHVYTGLGYSPAQKFESTPKKSEKGVFHLPAYTSTSSSFKQSRGFANELAPSKKDEAHDVIPDDTGKVRHILKLHVPAGTHAMSTMKHSFAPLEKEILIHRGHDVEVDPKPQRHIDPRTGHLYHVWHGKLVDHAPSDFNAEDL